MLVLALYSNYVYLLLFIVQSRVAMRSAPSLPENGLRQLLRESVEYLLAISEEKRFQYSDVIDW